MHTHAHWAYTFIYFGIGRSQLAEFPFTPVGPTDAGGVSTCPLPQALMGAVHYLPAVGTPLLWPQK